MGVKLVSSSAGSVELVAPVTASNYTATMPAKTGTVAMDGPAFSATYSANTSVSTGTFTKLLAATTRFDTSSAYASSTFNPKVAGYYQMNFTVGTGLSASGYVAAAFYKNGSLYTYGSIIANSNTGPYLVGGTLIYLNGSTDTVEVYGYQTSGSTMNMYVPDFSGSLARAS